MNGAPDALHIFLLVLLATSCWAIHTLTQQLAHLRTVELPGLAEQNAHGRKAYAELAAANLHLREHLQQCHAEARRLVERHNEVVNAWHAHGGMSARDPQGNPYPTPFSRN
jgi:hypothetical protein